MFYVYISVLALNVSINASKWKRENALIFMKLRIGLDCDFRSGSETAYEIESLFLWILNLSELSNQKIKFHSEANQLRKSH